MNKGKKINIIINIIAIIILLLLVLILYIHFYDELQLLNTEEGRNELINKIQNTGIFGSIILVILQILQVVVAFIPGEFVELICGAMFGPLGGLLICLIGLNIGTMIIFALVKILGKPFVHENTKNTKLKLDFLKDPNRALIILFFIFLIPGIPKDILIYPIPLTKLKMHKFMIVSTIARIPSILSSTIIGSSILKGNYQLSIIVFVISLVFAILGLVFNKQIYNFIDNKFIKRKQKNENDILN